MGVFEKSRYIIQSKESIFRSPRHSAAPDLQPRSGLRVAVLRRRFSPLRRSFGHDGKFSQSRVILRDQAQRRRTAWISIILKKSPEKRAKSSFPKMRSETGERAGIGRLTESRRLWGDGGWLLFSQRLNCQALSATLISGQGKHPHWRGRAVSPGRRDDPLSFSGEDGPKVRVRVSYISM